VEVGPGLDANGDAADTEADAKTGPYRQNYSETDTISDGNSALGDHLGR
jgi:hypothetical protein